MSVAAVVAQTQDLTSGSIRLAQEIDHATAGRRLARVVETTMDTDMGPYNGVRGAVAAQLDRFGGAGSRLPLFMLAADMATTAVLNANSLTPDERRELTQLWDHLRSPR